MAVGAASDRGDSRTPSDAAFAGSLIIAIVVVGVVTRSPQLLSGRVLVDGDEAVLGLMATHLADGRELPIFFYGQNYGFSLIEAAAGALAFKLAAVSSLSLKAAMLGLWIAGVVFLSLAVWRWSCRSAAVLVAALALFCPAWGAWSMKARGGYITAFVATSIALWLIGRHGAPGSGFGVQRSDSCDSRARALAHWIGIGVCVAIAALGQPLWALGLSPFLTLTLATAARRREAALAVVTAVMTAAIVFTAGAAHESPYWAPRLLAAPDPLRAASLLPQRLWVTLGGAHDFTTASGGLTIHLASAAWVALLLITLGLALRSLRRREWLDPAVAGGASLLLLLAFAIACSPERFAYHYLLPLAGFVAFTLAVAVGPWLELRGRLRNWLHGGLAVTVIFGAAALWEFRKLPLCGFESLTQQTEPQLVDELIERLLAERIRHVYSVSRVFQWTIMFASREQVIARSVSPTDRRPEYPAAVDRAQRDGERVAMVLMRRDVEAPPLPQRGGRWRIGENFVIVPDPSAEALRRSGFRRAVPIGTVPEADAPHGREQPQTGD
jgi:hypothetical protein